MAILGSNLWGNLLVGKGFIWADEGKISARQNF